MTEDAGGVLSDARWARVKISTRWTGRMYVGRNKESVVNSVAASSPKQPRDGFGVRLLGALRIRGNWRRIDGARAAPVPSVFPCPVLHRLPLLHSVTT